MSEYLPVLELSSLDGNNGFQISGEAATNNSGYSVSAVGDLNGDGFADMIVSAHSASPNGSVSGASYVVFGAASGFIATLELSSLDGSNGFQINGEAAYDNAGKSVSSAGDVNGDGFDDVIVGAFGSDANGNSSGAAFVVFGKASGFGANYELSSLDGNNGFQISGEAAGDHVAAAVSSAGDINGDGFADMLIGASDMDPNGTGSGASYVVFGKASGFAANFDLATLDGNNGFQINGVAGGDHSGVALSSAGDLNGDGFSDFVIGADDADPNGSNSGSAYVVFGKASGFAASLELSGLDGNNGFRIDGEDGSDSLGKAVASAGDINGDGLEDLVVGALGTDTNGTVSGTAYVVFGTTASFDATLDLAGLDGENGFRILGEASPNRAGTSVSAAGDVNGDGFADLLVSADGVADNGGGSGATYVVFGKISGFDAAFELSAIDGNNGFQINGEAASDNSGRSVSGIGDANGDGFDDILIGAFGADPNGSASGASYVVFGSMPLEAVVRAGTSAANDIHGGNFDDTLAGLGGDDTLTAYDGDDSIAGADGEDDIDAGAGDDDVRAGSGFDTVSGGDGDDVISGGSGTLDLLLGDAGDDIIKGGSGGDAMNGGADTDALYGGSGDDAADGGDGSDLIDGGSGDDSLFGNFGTDVVYGRDGADNMTGGDGNDTLIGGDGADDLNGDDGDDRLEGGDGADVLNGGLGANRFSYETAADSTSVNFDTVKSANFAGDLWDVSGNVSGIDADITTGKLKLSNFDSKLTVIADAAHLGAHHAVLFTPDAGPFADDTFLIIDLNGDAGYQAGLDLVIRLNNAQNLGAIDKGDFI